MKTRRAKFPEAKIACSNSKRLVKTTATDYEKGTQPLGMHEAPGTRFESTGELFYRRPTKVPRFTVKLDPDSSFRSPT